MLREFTDQLQRKICISFPPKRIVSVVPSQTELLFDLGLNEEVVGITKFCIHPVEKFAERPKVGGTKKLNIEKIIQLQPELIIANKEENTRSDIEALAVHFPVWISDIQRVEDATHMIQQVGELLDKAPEAAYLNHLIQAGFTDLQLLAVQKRIDLKVAYAIWKDPYLFAGKNTFIDDVLRKVGLTNIVQEARYPELTLDELGRLKGITAKELPDYLLLSSEPYPFQQKHLEEIQSKLPTLRVLLVDGEMFSWYGSRLVKAISYLFELQKQLTT